MGSSSSKLQNSCDIQLHKWSSEEQCEECAVIYTLKGHSYPQRSCTVYYRATSEKLVIAMDDGLCQDNRVRVNIEIMAVRDQNGSFKFGAVRSKDSGNRYIQRRESNAGPFGELYLAYKDSGTRVVNVVVNVLHFYQQITLLQKREYKFHFYTMIGSLTYIHEITIHCDSSKGIYVNSNHPTWMSGSFRMPPYDVMKIVQKVRDQLKMEGTTSVGAPDDDHRAPQSQYIYNSGYFVYNSGNPSGNDNGCIINGDNQHR